MRECGIRRGFGFRVSSFLRPSSFVIRHLLGSYACRRGDRSSSSSSKYGHKTYLRLEVVGVTGFEPATSWSQTTRSTKLSYTPRWRMHITHARVSHPKISARPVVAATALPSSLRRVRPVAD